MIIIGEKINGSIPAVAKAIAERDADFIKARAIAQEEAGATFIDCCASVPEEVEVEIKPTDIKVESCKSSGAGGQHINKTESAVRITHLPSGIVVECQEERSQFKNKDKAMKLLRTMLYDIKQREQTEAIANQRKTQVGTGDRSEKIRTYNFPQSRVSDHRIQLTLYSLSAFLDGDMDEMIDALATAETAEKLKGEQEE